MIVLVALAFLVGMALLTRELILSWNVPFFSRRTLWFYAMAFALIVFGHSSKWVVRSWHWELRDHPDGTRAWERVEDAGK